MFSESFSNSPNPFIQSALARLTEKMNLPEEKKTPQKSTAANALVQKQKWKMIPKMPGASNNTWSAMSLLNKGLSPMNKSAGSKSQLLLDILKPAGTGKAVGNMMPGTPLGKDLLRRSRHFDAVPEAGSRNPMTLLPEWAGGRTAQDKQILNAFHDARVADRATLPQIGVDLAKRHPVGATIAAGVPLTAGGLYAGNSYVNSKLKQVEQNVMGKVQPTLDKADATFANVNNALAPFQGNSNSYLGGVWESFLALIHRLFGGGRSAANANKYMDPLTGSGSATAQAIARGKTSSFNTGEKKMTTLEALNLALCGSSQFQKNASAGAKVQPDRVLNAHRILADRMRKSAAWLYKKEAGNPFVNVLYRAADQVDKGIPARSAVIEEVGRSEKLAAIIVPVVEEMACNIFTERVTSDFHKKMAAAQKKAIFDFEERPGYTFDPTIPASVGSGVGLDIGSGSLYNLAK